MISTMPQVMGLYPRKGARAVGSDATRAARDRHAKGTESGRRNLHETDYTPWEVPKVTAWQDATILRGRVVMEGNGLPRDFKDGSFPERKVADEIRRTAGGLGKSYLPVCRGMVAPKGAGGKATQRSR